ncbi:MAG: hypothetical protein HY731_03800 [Candidatus Tectomicrobia bacterium]|nr:hypothetical protein [Candidatus Tectomicrobia bacterium]
MEHIGTPEIDTRYWDHQDLPFDCAVDAQRGIIEEFVGRHVSETEAVYVSVANGWLTPGGTNPDDIGKLLACYGIPNHRVDGASIEQLAWELYHGHKIVVGVDSGGLRDQDPLQATIHNLREAFGLQPADHAIWVTGLDLSDPHHAKVIVNDSGDPHGAGKAYPLDRFLNAWKDSNFFYVATDYAPPGHQGFDYGQGHYVGPTHDYFQQLPTAMSGFDSAWLHFEPNLSLPDLDEAQWDNILVNV